MQTNLDRITLLILAALGLPLGCAVGPGAIDGTDSETTGTPGDGDGDAEGSGDGDGDGDSGTTETGGEEPYVCDNPEPIMQPGTDQPTGFVRCEDGFVHRVEAVECVNPTGVDSALCAEFPGSCGTAADCVDKPFGSCQDDGFAGCVCNYGCSSDADCDAGYICACAGVVGAQATCIPAGCSDDAACGDDLCGLSTYEGCCGNSYQLACAGPDEECHVNADCSVDLCDASWPDGGEVMHQCSYDGQAWVCAPPGWCGCDCGRPFFVDGEARVAPAVARRDWAESANPSPVAPALARALAEYWTEVGQFEHASIASFSRFAAQLLSLGAPPQLLADTRTALADEIAHARLAFGLASAYAAKPIGPGALAVGQCLRERDVFAIVEGLIVEACVGETLAAIEAQEAADHARDPVVAELLKRIAADELRHAQLGWRSLRWILAGADASVRRFARRRLAEAIAEVAHQPSDRGHASALREHGVLDDALRAEVRGHALARVVRPCADALARAIALQDSRDRLAQPQLRGIAGEAGVPGHADLERA